ncbi:MAG TPA: DUF167 domain-containing protein [Phycisphaerae bacterium]|jgi:hypothetical protein
MIDIREDAGGVLIPVKVVPGASRTRLMGEWDGRLKIAVAAPPEKGGANRAVCAFLAEQLGLRRQNVRVAQGTTTPLKIIRVENTTADACRRALRL